MRFSTYNICTKLSSPSDNYLILHGFTGAVDKVNKVLGEAIINKNGQECDTLVDIVGQDKIDYLYKRGYITDLSLSEEKNILFKITQTIHLNDLENSSQGFMFIPAYTCNLRCPYCFQPHDMHKGKDKFSMILSRSQVDNAFNIIAKYNYAGSIAAEFGLINGENLEIKNMSKQIGLFGGEPLSSSTLEIVDYIVEKSVEQNYTVSAITNGVELSKFYHLLHPNKLNELQITLDGTSKFHDRKRVGPGFKQTFQIISDNISYSLANDIKINLRMNVDSTNAAEIESLNEYCIEKGWNKFENFSAHAASISSESQHKNLISSEELVRRTMDLKEKNKNSVFSSYETTARELINNCILEEGYPFRAVSNCSAETGLVMFDPLNNVYSCWEEVGITDKRTGYYNEKGIFFNDLIKEKWLSRFPGAIENCSVCPYALIHTSGCAKHAEDISGTVFYNACENFQEYFPETLANAYLNLEKELNITNSN